MKKLIDEFAGRNIVFISISGDKDKQAWESMLRDGYMLEDLKVMFNEKPNWIHLHDPINVQVNQKYQLTGWPTYCLIGPDGKFVNGRCPTPSASGLTELFITNLDCSNETKSINNAVGVNRNNYYKWRYYLIG